MGRGAHDTNTAAAAVALRAIDGGRQAAPTVRQPRLDARLDQLWLSRADDLHRVAVGMRRINSLSSAQLITLRDDLNALGAHVGLKACWQFVERVVPGYVHPRRFLAYMLAPGQAHVLNDDFTGATIAGMSEPRYLGRRIAELADTVVAYGAA
jgi:hypothetical protein